MKKIAFFLLLCIAMISCDNGKTYVLIETPYGEMKAELYDSTPKHRDNFIKLVNEGFYNDLLFHRVMKGFMIQGGDPQSRGAEADKPLGTGGPGYLLDAEIGAPHFKGTLAAARTPDQVNPEKKSSGSQFYIVHGQAVSDAMLDSFEKRKGITYNKAQREKYKKLGGAPVLDMDYTVFGELVTGLDVLDKIASVQTHKTGGLKNRPLKDIKMTITTK